MSAKWLVIVGMSTGFILQPLSYAASDQKRKQTDDDVARAIEFERHKERAAARQMRLDAQRSKAQSATPSAERSADGSNSGRSAEKRQTRKPQPRQENRQ